MTTPASVDVIVVGSGPVGMTLAGLLGGRGISTLVLEKDSDVFALPRAAHIDHTGLRTMQEIGCLDELMARMVPNRGLVLADQQLRPLITVPGDQGSLSGLPASMYFHQPEFDRTLEGHIRALDAVEVRRDEEVVSFQQDGDGVTVAHRSTKTGEQARVRGRWLVGCDGASSLVREALGIELDSLTFDERWLVLDLAQTGQHADVPDYAIQVCDPRRPWVANPIPGGRYRAEFRLFDDETIETLSTTELLDRVLAPLLSAAEFEVERKAIYTFHGLIARQWRRGRVLVAGDAAHQMPPFLGQGMCSGIRDAANLAWKLSGVVSGALDDQLLDTYQAERAPHVRSVAASAVAFGRFVSVSDPEAVRRRNNELRHGLTSALTFRLPPLTAGPLVGAGGGMLFPQPPSGDGSVSRLDDVLGKDVLIVTSRSGSSGAGEAWWRKQFNARVVCLDDLGESADGLRDWFRRRGATVAVVRPDRYVLTMGTDLDQLRESLTSPATPTRRGT
jgi:3-(3-hydroxy-phenyl)propionate hydroxylase